MAFLFTWNATFEGQPADTENASLGAGRIRDLKAAIAERLEIDHSWAGDASDGLHLQATMPQHATSPTVAANQGAFYVKDSSGTTVPFFKDDAGNTRQLLYGATGDKGDVTVSADGATWTIDNDVVTYAKMQNMTTSRILGRTTAGSGDIEELSLGAGLSMAAGVITGVPQADTAEVTAESAVAEYISPDRLKYSERVAKAWVHFNGVSDAINDSVNVSSITDNGTIDYTINFTTAMGNAYFCPAMATGDSGSANANWCICGIMAMSTTSLRAQLGFDDSNNSKNENEWCCVTIFGA